MRQRSSASCGITTWLRSPAAWRSARVRHTAVTAIAAGVFRSAVTPVSAATVFIAVAAIAPVSAVVSLARAQSIAPTQIPLTLYPDARLVPRGVLRVGFEPQYLAYDERFGPTGDVESLGSDLMTDSAGSNVLPSLLAPEEAVRRIGNLPDYRMTFGGLTTELEGDVRQLPFVFQFGVSNRLNVFVRVPFYTARIQSTVTLDSATGGVGWNQAAVESGSTAGRSQIQQLLMQLEAAAANLEMRIASSALGCPGSASCAQAQDLVNRTRMLIADLTQLSGVGVGGIVTDQPLPPFAPTQTSTAGIAILAAIEAISDELQALGAPRPTTMMALPASRLTAENFQSVFGSSAFGYTAFPLEFIKYRQRLGDMEVGLRWGLIQSPAFRATLGGTARLPTGTLDSPDHFIDIGTGQKQTDIVADLEAILTPGRALALAIAASYTLQLPDRRLRRVTSPHMPIALASTVAQVERDMGDIIRLSAYPSLRLSESFTAYLAAHYFRKEADAYAFAGTPPDHFQPGDADVLETDTRAESLSFGAGVHFYSAGGPNSLPVSAGIDYRAAYQGEGGLVPKDVSLNFYLRLHFRLLGNGEER